MSGGRQTDSLGFAPKLCLQQQPLLESPFSFSRLGMPLESRSGTGRYNWRLLAQTSSRRGHLYVYAIATTVSCVPHLPSARKFNLQRRKRKSFERCRIIRLIHASGFSGSPVLLAALSSLKQMSNLDIVGNSSRTLGKSRVGSL